MDWLAHQVRIHIVRVCKDAGVSKEEREQYEDDQPMPNRSKRVESHVFERLYLIVENHRKDGGRESHQKEALE